MSGARSWLASIFISRSIEGREYALDALRGLAIIGMIIVNHQPPKGTMYAPFVHAEWHGWTLADTIFPAFLFTVGVSIVLALPNAVDRAASAPEGTVYARIVRRWLLLVVISMVLVNFPYFELNQLRVSGVLAQVGWCYLVVSLMHLHLGWRGMLAAFVLISLSSWGALAWIDVPGFGAGQLTPDGNASRYLDHLILGRHAQMFEFGEKGGYGLLVIYSSISSTITGVLAGHWLRSAHPQSEKIAGLFAAGFALDLVACAWDTFLPINKLLWTSSFVFMTTGTALQVLGLLYWCDRLRDFKRWARPLQIAGVNALFFYVFAQSFQRLLVFGRIRGEEGVPVRLRMLIYDHVFAPWVGGKLGALLYTLAFMSVCFAVIYVLFRKKIFIKL
jgi:predicted acyltransferase